MNKKSLLIILAGILVFGILVIACAKETGQQETPQQVRQLQIPEPLKGVSFSPKSLVQDDMLDFLGKVNETQDVLLWVGDWMELEEEKAPSILTELSKQYDYVQIIEVGHYIQSSGELIRPLNEENRKSYKDGTIKYIEKYKPGYFGMGVETNIFAENNPSGICNRYKTGT